MNAKRWPPPGFPIVSGFHQIDDEWAIELPCEFTRRVEDGSLVLWRPGLTLWISSYTNEDDVSRDQRIAWFREDASPNRTRERIAETPPFDLLTYELLDENEDGPVASVHSYAVADRGHLQVAIYHEGDNLDLARDLATAVLPAE